MAPKAGPKALAKAKAHAKAAAQAHAKAKAQAKAHAHAVPKGHGRPRHNGGGGGGGGDPEPEAEPPGPGPMAPIDDQGINPNRIYRAGMLRGGIEALRAASTTANNHIAWAQLTARTINWMRADNADNGEMEFQVALAANGMVTDIFREIEFLLE